MRSMVGWSVVSAVGTSYAVSYEFFGGGVRS